MDENGLPALEMSWSRRALLAGAIAWPVSAAMATQPRASDRITEAFLAAFPLYEMARLGAQARAGINQLNHRATLAQPSDRRITMPNNDTLYSSMWFDLSTSAIDLDLPINNGTYFSGTVIDAFTNVAAIIGTGQHRINAARVRLVGPGWRGNTPPDRQLVRCPTTDGWFLARIGVPDPTDLTAARAVQNAIRIETVATAAAVPALLHPSGAADPANALAVVNNRLERSARLYPSTRAMRRFSAQGIGAGAADWSSLLAEAQAEWASLWQEPRRVISDASRFSTIRNGWSWPNPAVGQFGTDFAYRAAIALSGIGALTETEAMYLTAFADADGQPLVPSARYRWTIPGGTLPVNGFWSLTAYQAEPDGRFFLYENPMARYAIGDRTPGLIREANGDLVIAIRSDRPAEGSANWLPIPNGPFRLVLRAYRPARRFFERRVEVSALQRL
jgi:hypothetical protein